MKLLRIILVILFFQLFTEVKAQWSVRHLDENEYTWNNLLKFKNDSLGLFMGSNSVILKSIDAGETWIPIHLKTIINLNDFQFVGDSVVYAIGDSDYENGESRISILLKSFDNGETWDTIANFPRQMLFSLSFQDSSTGIVAGYSGIYQTADSGKTWNSVWDYTLLDYLNVELKKTCFTNSKIGFAVGIGNPKYGMYDNILLKTVDSGMTWDTLCTFQQDLTSVYFLNAATGFVGTEPGILYKTLDGGLTWKEKIITGFWNSISSIQFISDKIGFVVGHQRAITTGGGSSTSFFISKTIDGGENWETFNSDGIPLNSVYFINDSVGFVSGMYSLIMKKSGKINELPVDYPWHLVQYGSAGKSLNKQKSLVKAFPNPTTGMLILQIQNSDAYPESIRLLSSSGQIIDIGDLKLDSNTFQLDLSRLISGIYFFQVNFLNKTELVKVVKN